MRKRILVLSLASFLAPTILAQRVVDVDKFEGNALNFLKTVGGEPVINTKFVKVVEGSPYFTDGWLKGTVFIEESEYRNFYLRINILETSLEFMDKKGETMVCTMPIKQVILNDSAKGVQYHFVHSSFLPENTESRKCWLMELASGKAGLYKMEKKVINEMRPYGSATTEQRILNSYFYFVLHNNSLVRVKKINEVPDFLSSQKQPLLDYIKANRLSAKDEKDMVRLINYYNSL